MARKKHTKTIEVVNPICCGLDIHKKVISACLMYTDEEGQEQAITSEFGGFTDELIRLRDWLLANDCPVVAMESTGIYWRPIHNVLEGYLRVVLVNARHYRNVPGKKTDLKDSQWIAGLLRHGLLKGSFIPPEEVRVWRDFNRLRKKYVETVGDHKRRVHKLFETANIKIDSVASDLFGASGRNLMQLLLHSSTKDISLEDVATCLCGSLRSKVDELYRAMQGFFKEHHRLMLASLLSTILHVEREIRKINRHLQELTASHQGLVDRLDELPGVDQVAARAILSNLGPTLEAFPTSGHLASWCGLCPGNHESAGKRKRGKSPVRGHPLKALMVEVAWAAVRKKGSYFREKYFRLKARRGTKRAIVAIAHRLLKAIFHIIKDGARFQDLGEEYLIRLTEQATVRRLHLQAYKYGYQLVPI